MVALGRHSLRTASLSGFPQHALCDQEWLEMEQQQKE